MARVISWRIEGKYVYIKPPYIRDAQVGTTELKQIKEEVLSWPRESGNPNYKDNFNAMKEAVLQRWGASVDLKEWNFYCDALEGEGVYMLTGIDGSNIADYGKPFYNLVIENNNTSLGLGGDYTLDVAVTLKTTIYLEKNGSKYAPDTVNVYNAGRPVDGVYTENGDEVPKKRVCIPIPAGTRFDSNEHVIEYTIEVLKDGYSGKVVFTVVGVKDGEEGVSYDLLVYPRAIKVTEDGNASAHTVKCKALRNGVDASSDPHIAIKYDFGAPTIDADDLTREYDIEGNGITYEEIAQNDDQVNFYLLFNNKIVDSDSCYISRDGQSGGYVKLELDNEMDGVSVGDDSDLDLEGGRTVITNTGFVLYSGGTKMQLTGEIKVENIDFTHASFTLEGENAGSSGPYRTNDKINADILEEGNGQKGKIYFEFENGFDFGEDYKDSIKITVWGTNPVNGVYTSATAIYTVMAIRGGKDGEVFKLVPNLDVIMCNPNAEKPFDTEAVPYLYADAYIGTERIQSPTITYSIDATYRTFGSTTGIPSDGISIQSLIDGDHDYVALYLWSGETPPILLDRETVPIIWDGADGSSVWVELGNEVDAVGVGNDTDLDIEEDVTLGTTVRIISGGTPVRISRIEVIKPSGTESNWNEYAESTTGFTGSDHATPDNGSHTIGYVGITLKNGFEFGPDYREAPTIKAVSEDGWSGFTQYIIKGIANGKDGYVYRLAPEVDYIHFHPNEGVAGTFDFGEGKISCTAFYGEHELGSAEFNDAKIYYSWNKICTTTADTSGGGYITGITDYEYTDGGVEVDGVINKDNYTNFKYLVFYLVKDSDIIDRETVPLIADGINGHDNVTVELTNEIESIGVGSDSKLDIEGEPASASTGIRMFSGATPMTITRVTAALSVNTDASSGSWESGWTEETQEFVIGLKNGFQFGSDLKEKVVITVTGKNDANEEATAYATFVLAAIKGGKDGAVYRVWPTPDYVYYDLQTGNWGGDTNGVRAYAFLNGKKMLEQGLTEGIDYQIKTTQGIVMDVDNAEAQWNNNGVLSNYNEGSPYSFSTPAGPTGREQSIVFYLAVKLNGSNSWTVVDRESVGLFINGKEGKDGTSANRFDLTNLFEVINTGDDAVLDATKTYRTTVRGYEGTKAVPINVTVSGGEPKFTPTTSLTDDNGVVVQVKIDSGYRFPSTLKKAVTIDAEFKSDPTAKAQLTFTIVAVQNGQKGDDAEGDSYKLRTNVAGAVYDGTEWTPGNISAKLYLGSSVIGCNMYFLYMETPLTIDQLMNPQTFTTTYASKVQTLTYTDGESAVKSLPITGGTNGIISQEDVSDAGNGTIYIAAFRGSSFLDAEDLQVTIAAPGGGSSGIIADLTDEIGVIATGNDDRLDAGGTLSTTLSVRNGFDKLSITSVQLPSTYTDPNGGGKITFSKGSTPSENVEITATIQINESQHQYIDFNEQNPLQFQIKATAVTSSDEEVDVAVGYSILGLKGGTDGWTVNLLLSADQIFYDPNKQQNNRFSPNQIKAKLFVNGVDYTVGHNISFDVKNSDMADPDQTELWIPMTPVMDGGYAVFDVTETSTNEFQPLVIRAMSGETGTIQTFVDAETVQILRNGRDGEGGISAKVEPADKWIPVEGGRPKTVYYGSSMVQLMSGSTKDTIRGITGTTSYSSFGRNDSSKHVSYKITDANVTGWKNIMITAKTDTDLSSAIQINLEVQSNTDPNVKAYTTLTLNPSTGGKGERGPMTRIRDFSTGYTYQDGKDGDEFLDIVYYSGNNGYGYFLCLKDQSVTPAVAPTFNSGGEGVDSEYWKFYPEAEFTASKVATFGTWPNGWVIDSGKIQHTQSGVTLSAEGSIDVAVPGGTVYEYKKETGSDLIYTSLDLTNSSVQSEYLNSAVPCISGGTKSTESGIVYITNGSICSNRFIAFSDSGEIKLYDSENGVENKVIKVSLSTNIEPYTSDLTSDNNYYFVSINARLGTVSTTLFYLISPSSTVASYLGKVTGTTPLSSIRFTRAMTADTSDGGYIGFLPEELEYEDGSSTTNIPVSVSVYTPSSVPIKTRVSEINPANITPLQVDNSGNISTRSGEEVKSTVLLYDRVESVRLTKCSNNAYTLSHATNLPASAWQTAMTIGDKVYVDVSSLQDAKVAGSIGDYSTSGYGTAPSVSYNYDTYKRQSGSYKTKQERRVVIDSQSDIAIAAGVYGNNIHNATTKIYQNGDIETSSLKATGGYFSGEIYATNGSFTGTVNIDGGKIRNAEITEALINGNIVLRGKNRIRLVNADGNEDIVISDDVITRTGSGGGKYTYPSSSLILPAQGAFWYNDRPNGTKSFGTTTELLVFDCQVTSGGTVSIPSITVTFDNRNGGVNNCDVTLRCYLISGNGSSSVKATKSASYGQVTDRGDHVKDVDTGSINFNIDANGTLAIRVSVSGEFRDRAGLFGDRKMRVTIQPFDVTATYLAEGGIRSGMQIGSNGFISVLPDGAVMSFIGNRGGGSVSNSEFYLEFPHGNAIEMSDNNFRFTISKLRTDGSYDIRTLDIWDLVK